MLKYTPHTFKKIETLIKEAGYQLRSGKGNFNTGYCILETKKVIVINKYHSIEAQINALIEIIQRIDIQLDALSDASKKWYEKLQKEIEKVQATKNDETGN